MIYRIFFLLLLSFSLTISQSAILKGKVIDSNTGASIQGAIIFLSYNHIAYTNSEGNYSIKNLDEGSYTLRVSHLGYKSVSEKIIINNISQVEKDFALIASPIFLDEVLVSSNRFEKYLRNSPFSEILLSSAQLNSKPLQSLPDALKNEPGITLLRDGVWGNEISIRGLSRENIVAMVDGNRLGTATDISARLSLVDINDIERIEIIKGAASSVYGSGATGGIINIITKSPDFHDTFSLNGNISTAYNSVNNSSSLSGNIGAGGQKWSARISGSFRKADNTNTPAGEIKNSRYKDYGASGSFNYAPIDNHLLKLNYQLFKAEDVGIPGGAPLFPDISDVRYPQEKRELYSAAYEIQNLSKVLNKFSVKYSHQFILRDVENIPHTIQNVPAAGSMPARRVSVNKITPGADHYNNNLQTQANLTIAPNNLLIVGVDYWSRSYKGKREKYQTIEALNPQGGVISTTQKIIGEKPLPDSKFESIGLFAQDEAQLLKEKLFLSVGARIDKINVTGEKTLNPVYEVVNGTINFAPAGQTVIWDKINADDYSYGSNVGLKYSASESVDLSLSLGYAYRSPSLEERFQFIDLGSLVRLGNPNLKSEKGYYTDFGIRYYSQNLKIISSLFYNYMTDLVSEEPGVYETRTARIKTNIGKARLYGFDLRADYNFFKDYVFYSTASYVKGDDLTKATNLPQIPPLNGTAGIKINLLNSLCMDLSSRIFAAQKNTAAGEISTPGYAVFDFSINTKSIKLSSLDLQFFAGVENILNKYYRDHLSTARGSITVEPGRNFYLKIITGW